MRTSPHELIRDPLEDPTRMSAYPNLEYGNLYNALTMLIDVAPCIQYGQIGKDLFALTYSSVLYFIDFLLQSSARLFCSVSAAYYLFSIRTLLIIYPI